MECNKKHKSRIECEIYQEWKSKFKKDQIILQQKCLYKPETANDHSVLIKYGWVFGDKSSINAYFLD